MGNSSSSVDELNIKPVAPLNTAPATLTVEHLEEGFDEKAPPSSDPLCSDYAKLFQSGRFADCTFVVGSSKERFPAHRALLAARSKVSALSSGLDAQFSALILCCARALVQVFEAMLYSRFVEGGAQSEIDIVDVVRFTWLQYARLFASRLVAACRSRMCSARCCSRSTRTASISTRTPCSREHAPMSRALLLFLSCLILLHSGFCMRPRSTSSIRWRPCVSSICRRCVNQSCPVIRSAAVEAHLDIGFAGHHV